MKHVVKHVVKCVVHLVVKRAVNALALVVACFAICVTLLFPAPATAQTDPRGRLRTITTKHFYVHFRAEHEALARSAAAYSEAAYAALSAELTAPRGRIELAITDNLDGSNGYATTFPTNRVVIYAVPPVTVQELRFTDDWLRLVITHELAHIFHLDRARGIWAVGHAVLGRHPLLFPNAFTPSWVKEGLAVYYETKLTGSGRNAGTEFPLVVRAAARDSAIPPMSRWSLATTRFPLGQTAYAWGTQLMTRAAEGAGARSGGNAADGANRSKQYGMREFVDRTAAFPIPYLLNARAKAGFGTSFSDLFAGYRDSLLTAVAVLDRSGDARWRTVSQDGWFADAPRWKSNDTIMWAASNGREVTGLYEAGIGGEPQRVARRNGTDVNVPRGGDSTVFAQPDFTDLYSLRYDLYEGHGRDERAITSGARLTQPDVRRDGLVVAVQLEGGGSRLVSVTRDGQVTPITQVAPTAQAADAAPRSLWAEPRWSPDGRFIAATELLPSGEQRIVVLDSAGAIVRVVAGMRAVFAAPAFTPDGRRLVWTSDRSGRMQLETASIDLAAMSRVTPDTLGWRTERETVRAASNVTTGVYQPSISPDGRQVAALVYRVDGFHVAVAPLDTTGPIARGGWYATAQENDARAGSRAAQQTAAVADVAAARTGGYRWTRQLLPRYWSPELGIGRDDATTIGASSGSSDILGRHEWFARALYNPRLEETDGSVFYRYRGFGQPILDVALSQEWDATFRVAAPAGGTLGDVARRRRFLSIGTGFSRPRVRVSYNGSLGAQYEWRDFAAAADSILGPANSVLRTGARYPSLLASGGVSTVRRGGRGIAFEEGFTLSGNTVYRWRQDVPRTGSWRTVGTGRGYLPLDLPGFARHVLSARITAGIADERTATEFSIGGVSGLATDVIPGVTVGDPARSFPVRGVEPDAQRGIRAVGGTVEYRVPLRMFSDLPSPFTLYTDRIALTLFSDAARATCPAALAATNSPVCERPGVRDGIIASAGGELSVDVAIQYDVPLRLRIGAGIPMAAPPGISTKGRFYLTLGSLF
ncbi:MAG TPA: hypothetical protein VE869_00740 [Gemmatimonas sp.]|nr:hypothetical protein [Gemmatimonas sp.]